MTAESSSGVSKPPISTSDRPHATVREGEKPPEGIVKTSPLAAKASLSWDSLAFLRSHRRRAQKFNHHSRYKQQRKTVTEAQSSRGWSAGAPLWSRNSDKRFTGRKARRGTHLGSVQTPRRDSSRLFRERLSLKSRLGFFCVVDMLSLGMSSSLGYSHLFSQF